MECKLVIQAPLANSESTVQSVTLSKYPWHKQSLKHDYSYLMLQLNFMIKLYIFIISLPVFIKSHRTMDPVCLKSDTHCNLHNRHTKRDVFVGRKVKKDR